MKTNLFLILLAVGVILSCNAPQDHHETANANAEKTGPELPVEFASESLSNVCKAGLGHLSSGDIDSFVSAMAENCVYRFNSGDSISGKPAITKYWKERRGNVIDKIDFSNDIWLPVKVNESNPQNVRRGNWVLGWFMTTATYKSGKTMQQNIHTLYHFNEDEQIDEVIQFLDRASINAAMSK